MLRNRPSYIIIFIALSLFFNCQCGYTQTLAELDEIQYNLNFFTNSYDAKTKNLISNIQISLKEHWKIFAKNKADEKIQIKILLEKTRNISAINIEWPSPVLENRSFYFVESLKVPVLITVIDPSLNTAFDLNISLSVCAKTCSIKKHTLHINMPAVKELYNENTSLIKMLFVAFIGGIILNVMPCVLPVLSIKLLSIISCGDRSERFVRYQFIAITCGIIFSFLMLASLTNVLKISGEYVGFGLNFQQPEFIIFLILVLLLFAGSLANRISFNIPEKVSNALIKYSDESKLFGSFLSGAFVTLVATPCTAPFVGSAISFALLYSSLEIYLIFLAIGFGMALPYIALILNPNLIKMLPKPGKWMVTIKKLLVIIVYLTVFWLIFILSKLLDQKAAILLFMTCLLFQFIVENKQWILQYTTIKLILCILVVAIGVPLEFPRNFRKHHQCQVKPWLKIF